MTWRVTCHATVTWPRVTKPGSAQTPDSRRHLTPRLQRLAGRCDAGPVINSNKFIHLCLSLSFRDCAGNVTKLSTWHWRLFRPLPVPLFQIWSNILTSPMRCNVTESKSIKLTALTFSSCLRLIRLFDCRAAFNYFLFLDQIRVPTESNNFTLSLLRHSDSDTAYKTWDTAFGIHIQRFLSFVIKLIVLFVVI